MTSYPLARTAELVERVLDTVGDLAYVVDPSPRVFEALVDAMDPEADGTTARFIVDADQLKDQTEDFLFASSLADLLAADAVAARTDTGFLNANLLVTDDRAVQLFTFNGHGAGVETDDADIVGALDRHYAERWEDAEPFSLRTPGRRTIETTLSDELGPNAEADFTAVVDSLETARGGRGGLDEVMIALLVAAKNEALLYDVSKWGEDIGLASKATFSRTKSRLEDLGLLDTEKVPIDVGRPRLRLKFADERLRSASADELASVAQGLLS